MLRLAIVTVVLISITGSTGSNSLLGAIISPLSVHVWPNERYSNSIPSLAIDGSLNTYTWSTEAFNTSSASLGLELGSLTTITRIRLWKDASTGDPVNPGSGRKDLVVQYTTDMSPTLSARTWANVTGLKNGYDGAELLNATAINSNGTVTGDIHNSSAGSGWASLTFDPVQSTGLRILFSKTSGETYNFMHYKVYELQVFGTSDGGGSGGVVPEPTTVLIFATLLGAAVLSKAFGFHYAIRGDLKSR